MYKKVRNKTKIQKPTYKQKWNKQIKFFHNKGSQHFFLSTGQKRCFVMGHDLTTHPALNKKGNPKRKYIELRNNPNHKDKRTSYVDKHLRKNISIYFVDTGRKRLTEKKKWKLSNYDKKRIKKEDRNKT